MKTHKEIAVMKDEFGRRIVHTEKILHLTFRDGQLIETSNQFAVGNAAVVRRAHGRHSVLNVSGPEGSIHGAAHRIRLSGSTGRMHVDGCTRRRRGRAEAWYEARCSQCHGSEGRGAKGPSLVPFEWSYQQALELIRQPVCDMPPIPASEVSDAEVAQIVEYLKRIK